MYQIYQHSYVAGICGTGFNTLKSHPVKSAFPRGGGQGVSLRAVKGCSLRALYQGPWVSDALVCLCIFFQEYMY